MNIDPDVIAALFETAVVTADQARPRTIQSREGLLGMSDLGFCRHKALLTLRQVQHSDAKSSWPAIIGTALGETIEAAIKQMFPDWLVGSIDGTRVVFKLPSGLEVPGTPDVIAPNLNAVLDIKTKDGLAVARRATTELGFRYQRHGYAAGCIDAGLLDGSKPVYVGNVYFDRSGGESTPHVDIEVYDPSLTHEIDQWLGDVIYARMNNEDAPRDIAPPRCQQMCEFFTVCRGGMLPASEHDINHDTYWIEVVESYVLGSEMAKQGKALTEAARAELIGHNGVARTKDGPVQVRSTWVNDSEKDGKTKAGHYRLDVRPVTLTGPIPEGDDL